MLVGVYGASGFGREVMPLARKQFAALEARLVFIDDGTTENNLNGHDILNFEQFLSEDDQNKFATIAISDSEIRRKLANLCSRENIKFCSIVDSSHVRMDNVEVGDGSIISPFVTFTSDIRIGSHFHANIYSYIAHDCEIGNYVTFAPGVHCNGNIIIEDHAYIGTGSIIRQGTPNQKLTIGKGAVVGMGAVVTKDVPPGTVVVGNPARPMERPGASKTV